MRWAHSATEFSGFSVTADIAELRDVVVGFSAGVASSASAVVAARAPRIADTARATSGEPQLRCELYILCLSPKTVRKVRRVRAAHPTCSKLDGIAGQGGRALRMHERVCRLLEVVAVSEQLRFLEGATEEGDRYGQPVFGDTGGHDEIGKPVSFAKLVAESVPAVGLGGSVGVMSVAGAAASGTRSHRADTC